MHLLPFRDFWVFTFLNQKVVVTGLLAWNTVTDDARLFIETRLLNYLTWLLLGHDAETLSVLLAVKLLLVVLEEKIVFCYFVFYLRQASCGPLSAIVKLYSVLSDLDLFQGINQFFADTNNVRTKMGPFYLTFIQCLLSKLLFFLQANHCSLHLRKSIARFCVITNTCSLKDREKL